MFISQDLKIEVLFLLQYLFNRNLMWTYQASDKNHWFNSNGIKITGLLTFLYLRLDQRAFISPSPLSWKHSHCDASFSPPLFLLTQLERSWQVNKKYSSMLHSEWFVQEDDSFNFIKAQQARTVDDQVKKRERGWGRGRSVRRIYVTRNNI